MGVIQRVTEVLAADPSLQVSYDPPAEGPRDGTCVPLDESHLSSNVQDYLRSSFPNGLFTHQHQAVEHVLSGEDTVVATRTSSGKSLIYSLPVLDSLCRDQRSTAMFLFPQKALANDQQLKLRSMASQIAGVRQMQDNNPLLISRYDGGTPRDIRKTIREKGQVILTNPDMLHMGIMQFHDSNWDRFFANLSLVAVDECHEYRGVFGTNVAYILHRLRQICDMHGSSPTFVATSATVKDPQEHMERLTGVPFRCVDSDEDGSAQGRRKFWMVRGEEHFYDTGRKLATSLAESGLTVLVFCPSRVSAERMISRTVKPGEIENSYIRVYRSGLSAHQREEIEQGLRSKDVRLVFSTSALELGIDIGEIDVVVCVGLPHSMMSLWQRAGRSARGGREGATIFIPADTPIDSYYANHPEELFARDHEPLVLNLHNRRIVCQQYACAVQEIGKDESQLNIDILGAEMAKIQQLRLEGKLSHDIFYCSEPHVEVNIRSGGERSFTLINGDDEEIGEIDYFHLLRECYTNAIYRHGGRAFRVLNVLYGKKRIRLKPEYSLNETTPHLQRKIRLKNQYRVADYGELRVSTASLDVTEFLVSVSEKDRSGNTVMTWQGSSGMRQYQLPTEGTVLSFSKPFWQAVSAKLGGHTSSALSSMERLLASLFPTITGPCDTQDYSSAVDRLATDENAVFLFDMVYDGVDLTSAAFDKMPELVEKAIERVSHCSCPKDDGCFRCIANPIAESPASKKATLEFLLAIKGVLDAKSPAITTNDRDWDADLVAPEKVECKTCGHEFSIGAKFCSECGTKAEA
ncbi:MAG: DEAD/DEAH box helicase [Planctomycetaceae bacterium]|nr:DEAD/DEAH box helicase [Planctomycetaceae bacterium]